MCEIVFHKLGERERPAAGELWVRPAAEEDRKARAVALVVFDKGLEALEQGPGPVGRVVVDVEGVHPTFDEMLAALFAQRLLHEPPLPLPPAFRAFAEYARQLAQGLPPTRFPPEETIEGVFLAVRNLAGAGVASPDLADPVIAAQFLRRWQPFADHLLRAAEGGADPFGRPLFRGGAEFAREKAFVRRDKGRYRRDVRGGERWTVQLPGMKRPGSGLLLRRPRSLLFPYWSRRDRDTPTGESYLFLAVDWGNGSWVFSTDPVQEDLKLKGLADPLQAAETEQAARGDRPARRWLHLGRGAAVAPAEPGAEADAAPAWYDGRDHGMTLVSSPKLAGTRLPEARLLDIVKKWARAKRYVPPKRPSAWPAAALAAACLLAVAVLAVVVFWPRPDLYVYDKTAPAVVLVKAGDEQGTGFLISDDGWLLTNYHVVRSGAARPRDGGAAGDRHPRPDVGRQNAGDPGPGPRVALQIRSPKGSGPPQADEEAGRAAGAALPDAGRGRLADPGDRGMLGGRQPRGRHEMAAAQRDGGRGGLLARGLAGHAGEQVDGRRQERARSFRAFLTG